MQTPLFILGLTAILGLVGFLGQLILKRLDSVSHLAERLEFILTGDKGMNGVRQEVKDVKSQLEEMRKSLFEQNEAAHQRLGEWSLWRQEIENRLKPKPRPRRKNGGRRSTDRKGA